MSGGHWDYRGFVIEELLREIGGDPQIGQRFPRLMVLLPKLGDILGTMEHDLDWDLSSDQSIKDDEAFQWKVLNDIKDAVDEATKR